MRISALHKVLFPGVLLLGLGLGACAPSHVGVSTVYAYDAAPYYVAASPGPDYVYVDGGWAWVGGHSHRHHWFGSHWARPHYYGYGWAPTHRVYRTRSYTYVPRYTTRPTAPPPRHERRVYSGYYH